MLLSDLAIRNDNTVTKTLNRNSEGLYSALALTALLYDH